MFNNSNGYSLADIAAATGGNNRNDGMWDNGAWWIIILFLFCFNGGMWGNGFGRGMGGRSPVTRRMYMESKQLHKDKTEKVKELEKYMQELSEDIVEMIDGASPEERQVLEKKMTSLTNKIAQLNLNA